MILSRPIPLLSYVLFICIFEKIDGVIFSGTKGSGSSKNYRHTGTDFTIQKVSLTQKGYIQFLKYTTKVPLMTDYTFCIWVRSNNFTYNHPLLSYSKHEEERLIRVWISEKGKDLCLELLGHPIFKVEVNFVENTWYHVCQSWSSQLASWELFFNGQPKSNGFVPHLKGIPIKGGGDIVVGQEYTDFDKGLDDGIEGDVFGFNFVLSSTSKEFSSPIKFANYPLRRGFDEAKHKPKLHGRPMNIYKPHDLSNYLISADNGLNTREILPVLSTDLHGPDPPRYYPRRRFARNIFQDMMSLFEAEVQASHIPVYNKFYSKIPFYNNELTGRRISNEIIYENPKPLGLLLVELSFDCGFKKGAPLNGKGVLISWTKSPVRVFGGAILKEIPPFCRLEDS